MELEDLVLIEDIEYGDFVPDCWGTALLLAIFALWIYGIFTSKSVYVVYIPKTTRYTTITYNTDLKNAKNKGIPGPRYATYNGSY